MRLRTGFFSASRFRMTGKQCHPEQSDLPTRRDGRGASPMRASFHSHSPPQIRSLPLPLAAVAYLPPSGHARIPSVEQPSSGTRPSTSGILRPHGLRMTKSAVILSEAKDPVRRTSCSGTRSPTYGILRPHGLRMTEHCHPERKRRIPSVEQRADGTRPPTYGILRPHSLRMTEYLSS